MERLLKQIEQLEQEKEVLKMGNVGKRFKVTNLDLFDIEEGLIRENDIVTLIRHTGISTGLFETEKGFKTVLTYSQVKEID